MFTIKNLRALLVAGLALAALAAAMVAIAAPKGSHTQSKDIVCSECHSCGNPTRSEPCLKICPRPHGSAKDLKAGPDVVTLNQLEWEYEPVIFEHRLHAQMSTMGNECENCHHFSEGGRITSCNECHPAGAAEHLEQPGLKGAYHRQCMGCHDEWSGSSDCNVCHAKKAVPGPSMVDENVQAMPRHTLAPLEQPEKKVWNSTFGGGTVVTLFHRNHSEKYGVECATCHHAEGCGSCHQRSETTTTEVRHSEEALHAICNGCHAEMSCNQCHLKSEATEFSHDRTGWPLKRYHRDLRCRSCHGNPNHFTKPSGICTACHSNWALGKFDHARTGLVLDETHREIECTECHANQDYAAKPACASCHGDEPMFPAKVPGQYKG